MEIKIKSTKEHGKGQTDVELEINGKSLTVRVNRIGKAAEEAAKASITDEDVALLMQEVQRPAPAKREKP